jgi:hypothetical protein
MIIWSKFHLTESFFRKMVFDRKVIWPKGHLTECFFLKSCRFWKKIIWPTVHIIKFKKRKAFPILMMNQGKITFCQILSTNELSVKWSFFGKSFRSYKLSVKWPFGQMTTFRKCFWSNELSVIWLIFQVIYSVKWLFFKYFQTTFW